MSQSAAVVRGPRGGLWRHRDFRLFWIGETTSQLGTAVSTVALPLVAVELLHAGAFLVTSLTAGAWLPWLILGLPAGGWVDRLPRRPVMLICDALSFAAFLTVPIAAWLSALTAIQLVAVALVAGAAAVFFRTAYRVYLPSVIDEADLTEGNAKMTGSRSAAQVAGPGLGGAIVQVAGAATGLLANAVSFAISFACLSSIRAQETPQDDQRQRRHLWPEVRIGLHFAFGDPFLRAILILSASANFFLTGMNAIEVLFLVRTVGIGPGAVGAVFAAGSTGGVLGAIIAPRLARRFGSARTALITDSLGLSAALVLPLTTSGAGLSLWIGGVFILEVGVVASNVLTGSFIQTYVPREMLGRVSSSTSTAGYSMMPAGALVAGALSTTLGLRTSMWILCAGVAASSIFYLASPMRATRNFPITPTNRSPTEHAPTAR